MTRRQYRESPMERTLRAQAAAHTRWAGTTDRTAALAPANKGMQAKFEKQVDPDGTLDPIIRARRAESARKAYFADLTRKSIAARRKRKAA